MSSTFGIQQIALERKRMAEELGWDEKWEDGQRITELQRAASCYLREPRDRPSARYKPPIDWPFRKDDWDPQASATERNIEGRLTELTRAGALITAEIDRIHRSMNTTK